MGKKSFLFVCSFVCFDIFFYLISINDVCSLASLQVTNLNKF